MSNAVPEQAVEAASRAVERERRAPMPTQNETDAQYITRLARAAIDAALPLMGVQREDVAAQDLVTRIRDGLSDTEHWQGFVRALLADAANMIEALAAIPHTGQPQEGECRHPIKQCGDPASCPAAVCTPPHIAAAPASPRAEDGTVKAYYIVNEHGKGTVYYGVSCESIPVNAAPVADKRTEG